MTLLHQNFFCLGLAPSENILARWLTSFLVHSTNKRDTNSSSSVDTTKSYKVTSNCNSDSVDATDDDSLFSGNSDSVDATDDDSLFNGNSDSVDATDDDSLFSGSSDSVDATDDKQPL